MKPFIALLLVFAAFFSACEKDPEVITKTVVETDTLYITQHDTVLLHITDTVTLTQFVNDTATIYILLRHAETTGSGSDPALSTEGIERAGELVRILKNVSINAVFSTNFNRTRQTAQAVADDKGLGNQTYDPLNQSPFIDATLDNYKGGAVLVVGHSNTIPSFLNLLVGSNTYPQIPDTQYDNLYIVSMLEKGRAKVVHLKYGKATP